MLLGDVWPPLLDVLKSEGGGALHVRQLFRRGVGESGFACKTQFEKLMACARAVVPWCGMQEFLGPTVTSITLWRWSGSTLNSSQCPRPSLSGWRDGVLSLTTLSCLSACVPCLLASIALVDCYLASPRLASPRASPRALPCALPCAVPCALPCALRLLPLWSTKEANGHTGLRSLWPKPSQATFIESWAESCAPHKFQSLVVL